MARIAQRITASEEDMQELLATSRSLKIEKRYSQRAEVILERKSIEKVMKSTSLGRPVVNKWRRRFRELSLHNCKRRERQPATKTASQKAMVIQKACEKPEGGYTNWSQKRIGTEAGISQSKVHQILKTADLEPHKKEYWHGKSPGPEFESARRL
jgi:transposase